MSPIWTENNVWYSSMKKLIAIIFSGIFLSLNVNANDTNTDELYKWIKNQTEFTNANQLIHDKEDRFEKLYISGLIDSKDLIIEFMNNLGGPPDPIFYYKNKRYVATGACKGRECPTKAFVFFDTKKKFTIGLIREYHGNIRIYSKTHKKYKDLPKIFNQSVKEWMKYVGITKQQIFFTGSDVVKVEITKKFK